VPLRDRARALVDDNRFQGFIIGVIALNGLTLGLETSRWLMANIGEFLHVVDHLTLGIFVAEIACRWYASGSRDFFRSAWNVFDCVIVGISLMPAAGALSVLRTLRMLRVLRLISAVPSMRKVVEGLLRAIPGIAAIAALLGLIIFVAGVMATMFFRDISVTHFGDLWSTMFTLFQIMTGEGWPEIARPIMARAPVAWLFFMIYILVSSFAVLNLFIAVIVKAVEQQNDGDELLDEVRALRAELRTAGLVRAEPVGAAESDRPAEGPPPNGRPDRQPTTS
jgi:voltage-gated sodium channel